MAPPCGHVSDLKSFKGAYGPIWHSIVTVSGHFYKKYAWAGDRFYYNDIMIGWWPLRNDCLVIMWMIRCKIVTFSVDSMITVIRNLCVERLKCYLLWANIREKKKWRWRQLYKHFMWLVINQWNGTSPLGPNWSHSPRYLLSTRHVTNPSNWHNSIFLMNVYRTL